MVWSGNSLVDTDLHVCHGGTLAAAVKDWDEVFTSYVTPYTGAIDDE